MRRARLHLSERWDQRVALADLAAVACLSRFGLVRRFHAETGLTPHAYPVNSRISRARALLGEGVTPAAVAAAAHCWATASRPLPWPPNVVSPTSRT